ncbi:MAG: flagellar hook-associated protein 1 [Oligoflexia bacterium]|nr:MAG: flagellar hook-associated protein 1 [Oligoflexia bacterium]
MAKIHSMMDIGKRTMMNSQTALQTAGHNIANKTTEGYSRQRVELVQAQPIGEGRLQMGMGARAAMVTRVNNPFLDKQLQKETGTMGFLDGRAEALSRVEQVFNEQMNKGLNQYVSDFFNAFRELSNNPESVTTRTMVKEAAEALTTDFERVHNQLEGVQKEVDMQITHTVEEINKMSKEVASLNEKIAAVEMQGVPANDERDRRETLIKKMMEKVDIKVAEGNTGMVSISTAGNAVLVSGLESMELTARHTHGTERMQIFYRTSSTTPDFNITDRVKGGTLGGALVVRDQIVPDLKQKVDNMAYTIANEVNKVHIHAYDKNGKVGNLFFDRLDGVEDAAKYIVVSDDILNDVTKISTAAKPNAPGDNTAANVISMLQYKEIMDEGSSTIDDYYNSQVGRIGVMANRANKAKESQANILQQISTIRESVSGVSLDEEATKMIEYQKAFDASARLIRTADEMFDTVLSLKRM